MRASQRAYLNPRQPLTRTNFNPELQDRIKCVENDGTPTRTRDILFWYATLVSLMYAQRGDRTIPAGTLTQVRTNQTIDSSSADRAMYLQGS
jgi:hypothetical protein